MHAKCCGISKRTWLHRKDSNTEFIASNDLRDIGSITADQILHQMHWIKFCIQPQTVRGSLMPSNSSSNSFLNSIQEINFQLHRLSRANSIYQNSVSNMQKPSFTARQVWALCWFFVYMIWRNVGLRKIAIIPIYSTQSLPRGSSITVISQN